jgi:hypothetical protein
MLRNIDGLSELAYLFAKIREFCADSLVALIYICPKMDHFLCEMYMCLGTSELFAWHMRLCRVTPSHVYVQQQVKPTARDSRPRPRLGTP